jgi:signal transduction histidine kinase
MERLVDRIADLGELEWTLRRIVVGARLVAAAWTVTLVAVAAIRRPEAVGHAGVVAAVLVGVILWAVGSVPAFRWAADSVTSRAALIADGVAGAVALMAPTWSGADADATYTGGLPFIVVAIASVRSRAAAWTMAGVMIVTTAIRAAGAEIGVGVIGSLSQVILYVAGAAIFTWVMGVLRRSDASRVTAERAAAASEAARAREVERAQISRHLHDSVLQTLALIQRSADSPADVTMLARRQERELREWLFGGLRSGGRLSEAVRQMAAEIEERHSVVVDVVAVGDRELDDRLAELVAAGREAVSNAAIHSATDHVSVYVEVGTDRVAMYVRDRGRGFTPEDVAEDRRGITQSIQARMRDLGGSADLKTAPGKGTEWTLEVAT